MPGRERGLSPPVRQHPFLPLPLEDFLEVGRPCAGDPVRVAGPQRVSGATAEEVDARDLELLRQLHGAPVHPVTGGRDLRARMQGIAVTRERRDLETAGSECVEVFLAATR